MRELALNGLRVMVVEDELLISMLIEDILLDQGCSIVGPYTSLTESLAAAQAEPIDLAILDVNLRGQKVYPVAEVLSRRRVPFVLLSGYGDNAVPAERRDWRAIGKPFQPDDLVRVLASMAGTKQDRP